MTDATPSAAAGTGAAIPPAGAKPEIGKAKGPIGALYNWVLRLAGSKHSGAALFGVSFAESSFFPIPPDVMLLPMCLARPERAFRYALICTIGSVLGGMLGYAIGYFLREWLLTFEMFQNQLKSFEEQFAIWGLWVILIKGLTPVPYKLVTIASGLALFNLPNFIMASIVTRGARFFLGAFLFKTFGPQVAPIIEKRINTFALIFVVILVGGFIAATMLH